MDPTNSELLGHLTNPFKNPDHDLNLIKSISDDKLIEAAINQDSDFRISFLYIMSHLLDLEPDRCFNILKKLKNLAPKHSLQTYIQFLTHTDSKKHEKIAQLINDLSENPPAIEDQETQKILKSFLSTKKPSSVSISPVVEKMVVIVHGTFASQESWWRWPSPFAKYLNDLTQGAVYKKEDPFSWSGQMYDKDRRDGAEGLKKWLKNHPTNELTIVAHSFGGAVAIFATRLGVKIDRLIILGCPARSDYTPDLRHVGILYNVCSFGDWLQTPTGSIPHTRGDGRTLGDSERLVNVLCTKGGTWRAPGHSELYTEEVWKENNLGQLLV